MGLAERLFEGLGKQMEIDGDDQPPGGNPDTHLGRKIGEADGAGRHEQEPIRVHDKFNNPLLSIHTNTFTVLKISQFLDGQTNVFYGCGDPKQKKNYGQPLPGIESGI